MKLDWELIYKKHGVRNIDQLINKYGGYRPAMRATGIMHKTLHGRQVLDNQKTFDNPTRVFYFTDTHVQPKLETDHLKHIAQHIKETNPDYIIHGGDFADAESLCSHIQPHTKTAREKPTLKSDIACMEDAMHLINSVSGRSDIHVTLGNHEARIWTMEENNPDLAYLLQERFDLAYKNTGWTYSPYCEYHTVAGVDFVHAPCLVKGRPVGGKLSANNVASNSIADCVYGHTHMKADFTVKKYGGDRSTTAINGGCSMPSGYIPKYVQGGSTGWWHGVIELGLLNGKIVDTQYISLDKLKRLYK